MLGINGWELVVLAIIALLVLGPEKLPSYAADAARMLRQLRRMAADAREEVTRDLGPEFRDISLQDLDPRTFVSKHLLDGEDFGLDDEDEEERRNRRRAGGRSGRAPRPDVDVTQRAGAAPAEHDDERSDPRQHDDARSDDRRSDDARTADTRTDDARTADRPGGGATRRTSSATAASAPDRPPYDLDAT